MDINTLATNIDNIKLEIEETLKRIEEENKNTDERKNEYKKKLECLKEKIDQYQLILDELKEKLNKKLPDNKESCCSIVFKTILVSFMIPIGAILLLEMVTQSVNKL